MADLFNNYVHGAAKRGPNNEDEELDIERDYWEDITRGQTATHEFKIPHTKDEIEDIAVAYRQGTKLIILKSFNDLTLKQYRLGDEQYCRITYTLTDDDTNAFNAYNSEVYAQIKVYLLSGEIEYSPEFKVHISDSLLNENKHPN